MKQDVDFDKTRTAISGFSSGSNIAPNINLSISPLHLKSNRPSLFPPDLPHLITVFLFDPSFDCHQLPSERTRPAGLPFAKGIWADLRDKLRPTGLLRSQAGYLCASSGLADERERKARQGCYTYCQNWTHSQDRTRCQEIGCRWRRKERKRRYLTLWSYSQWLRGKFDRNAKILNDIALSV